MPAPLKPGQKAPFFSVLDQNEKLVSLIDLQGQKLVLFFYPADLTPTCTTEACNLRDNHHLFEKKGFRIFGVSPDSPKSHRKFIEKYKLNYDLLSDENLKMIKSYRVWGEKILFGRKYMGLLRTTFVIDEKGIIEDIIHNVKSKDHTIQILK